MTINICRHLIESFSCCTSYIRCLVLLTLRHFRITDTSAMTQIIKSKHQGEKNSCCIFVACLAVSHCGYTQALVGSKGLSNSPIYWSVYWERFSLLVWAMRKTLHKMTRLVCLFRSTNGGENKNPQVWLTCSFFPYWVCNVGQTKSKYQKACMEVPFLHRTKGVCANIGRRQTQLHWQ